MSGRLEGNLQMLWDLETLGITESNEVHEEFVDNITFNGSRYSDTPILRNYCRHGRQ